MCYIFYQCCRFLNQWGTLYEFCQILNFATGQNKGAQISLFSQSLGAHGHTGYALWVLHAPCRCMHHIHNTQTHQGFNVLWCTYVGYANGEGGHVLEALSPAVWSSTALFPWFSSAVFPVCTCVLWIFLGIPREIKDASSCYDFSALNDAQKCLPHLTFTWQHP